MVNRVFLIGRLAADPDVRATANGGYVTSLRLATNTYAGKDDEGHRKEHAEFHNLVLFGKQAQVAGELLRKGRLLHAEGRLQTRSWDDAGGLKHYMTEVVVETFNLLEPKVHEAAA